MTVRTLSDEVIGVYVYPDGSTVLELKVAQRFFNFKARSGSFELRRGLVGGELVGARLRFNEYPMNLAQVTQIAFEMLTGEVRNDSV